MLNRWRAEYLAPAPARGWLDLLDSTGWNVATTPLMLASPFYHLAAALTEQN